MEDINIRFLKFYNYLVQENIVKNASEFTTITGVAPSLITELKKKRTNVGLNTLQCAVNHFPQLNTNWIFTGEGEMLKSEEAPTKGASASANEINELKASLSSIQLELEKAFLQLAQMDINARRAEIEAKLTKPGLSPGVTRVRPTVELGKKK